MKFPGVAGKALTGERTAFPDDLTKPFNLLAIAFLQEQQPDVDTWIPKMEAIEDSDESFSFYEIPTIGKMNPIMRWIIYRGMRGGIPSDRARKRTVTLHIDKAPFKQALGISTENTIHLFLVTADGKVLWRSSGRWSQEKEDQVRSLLRR